MFHLRRRLEQTPQEFEFLRNKLSQSREQLDHAQAQNERLVGCARPGKGADRGAPRRGGQAGGPAVQLRDDPPGPSGRHGGRVDRRAEAQGERHPRRGSGGAAPRPRGGPERGAERRGSERRRPAGRDRPPEGPPGRDARHGDAAGRRGAGGRTGGRPRRRPAAGGPAAAGRQSGGGPGEAPQGGGRGPGPGRGPQHHLHRYRRAGGADRPDPRRHRAAGPVRRPLRGAQAVAPQGGAAVRAAGLRQDAHRQSGGQRPGAAAQPARPARPAGRTSST